MELLSLQIKDIFWKQITFLSKRYSLAEPILLWSVLYGQMLSLKSVLFLIHVSVGSNVQVILKKSHKLSSRIK